MSGEEKTEWKLTRKETGQLREFQDREGGYRDLLRIVAILLTEHRTLMQKWFTEVAKAHQIPVEYPEMLTANSKKGIVCMSNRLE